MRWSTTQIFQLDESGRIATWNTGAQRIKGYTESEIMGKHLSTFYTEEDQKSGVPQRALETAGQTGKYEAEGWRVRKDGTKFWALVVIDAIRDQETGRAAHQQLSRRGGLVVRASPPRMPNSC